MKWQDLVKKFHKPGMPLGDAMKAASEHKKKLEKMKKGGATEEIITGGQLMGKATGAARPKKHTRKGGQLYSFTGGPYVGSELSDGAGRFPPYDLSSMQWQGANPAALSGGRRRTRRNRRRSTRSRKH